MPRLPAWLSTWGILAIWTGLLGGTALRAYLENGLLAVGIILLDIVVWAAGIRAYRLWADRRPRRRS